MFRVFSPKSTQHVVGNTCSVDLDGKYLFSNAVGSIAETFQDHILQDYHNLKSFGPDFTRVHITATMIPPFGQINTKYDPNQWNDPNVEIVDYNEINFSGLIRRVFILMLAR